MGPGLHHPCWADGRLLRGKASHTEQRWRWLDTGTQSRGSQRGAALWLCSSVETPPTQVSHRLLTRSYLFLATV